MRPGVQKGSDVFALLKQRHRLGGKGRKRGQTAQKTGHRKQAPLGREVRPVIEETHCHADQVSADQISDQRTQRQRR